MIGSEVPTPYGKRLDLLAIDADGNLHVLELKRDRTPREVVAQILDYGSWVSTLSREDVIDIATRQLQQPFEVAFEDVFGSAPPDELNNGELQPPAARAEDAEVLLEGQWVRLRDQVHMYPAAADRRRWSLGGDTTPEGASTSCPFAHLQTAHLCTSHML